MVPSTNYTYFEERLVTSPLHYVKNNGGAQLVDLENCDVGYIGILIIKCQPLHHIIY